MLFRSINGRPQIVSTPPQSVVATPGDSSVSLIWGAPLNTGGLPIKYYVEQYTAATNWIAAYGTNAGYVDSTVTQLTISGLLNGSDYQFRVSAESTAGRSTATTSDGTVRPGIFATSPRNLIGTPSDGQVVLSWTAPANNGGYPLVKYIVEQQIGATWVVLPVTTTGASATITGLTNGVSTNFRVSYLSRIGQGSYATIAATPGKVPTAPQNVSAVGSDGKVTLYWTPPQDSGEIGRAHV